MLDKHFLFQEHPLITSNGKVLMRFWFIFTLHYNPIIFPFVASQSNYHQILVGHYILDIVMKISFLLDCLFGYCFEADICVIICRIWAVCGRFSKPTDLIAYWLKLFGIITMNPTGAWCSDDNDRYIWNKNYGNVLSQINPTILRHVEKNLSLCSGMMLNRISY